MVRTAKLLTIMSVAMGLTAVGVTPAHAGMTDLIPALVAHADDVQTAAQEYRSGDPDITCDPTDVFGGAITQETNLVVGQIYGEDWGDGVGKCVSFDVPDYTGTVKLFMQYFDAVDNRWENTDCQTEPAPMVVVDGVGVGNAGPLQCVWDDFPSPYLDAYHRARLKITTSIGGPYNGYSTFWYMRKG